MLYPAKVRAARAVREVKNGGTIAGSSKAHDVERTYVRRRIKGIMTREEYNESLQKLSKQQEKLLSQWIVIQDQLGYAPPHARFRCFAQRLLINSGSTERLGTKWVSRFLERYPEIRTIKGVAMDYKRLNGATPESAKALFSNLSPSEVAKIPAQYRWNADEIGMMEGMGENNLVLGEAIRKAILMKDAHKREWISIIVFVSADGRALPPLVIFSGKSVQQQWFLETKGRLYDWHFHVSPNGWTNSEIGLQWLKDVFIPNTRPARATEWRLLIVDGHNSHITEDFMITCLIHRIYVIYLPAHSSQAFQPLDVGVFGFFNRRFRHHFRERCWGRASEATDKTDFLWALERAWEEVMDRTKWIISGFKTSGMWPVDIDKALNNKFVKASPQAQSVTSYKFEPAHPDPDFLVEVAELPAKTPKSSREVLVL